MNLTYGYLHIYIHIYLYIHISIYTFIHRTKKICNNDNKMIYTKMIYTFVVEIDNMMMITTVTILFPIMIKRNEKINIIIDKYIHIYIYVYI
jgi:hypothetical protein